MTDFQPASEQNINFEVGRSAGEYFSGLMATFADEVEFQRGDKKTVDSLRDLSQVLLPDPEKIESVDIYNQQVNIHNAERFLEGEDPGVHLFMKYKNGNEVHINIAGGMRKMVESDSRDNLKAEVLGHTSRETTHAVSSRSTQVNIHVLRSEDVKTRQKSYDLNMSLTPVLTPDEKQSVKITGFKKQSQYAGDLTKVDPTLRGEFNVRELRSTIRALVDARSKLS